VPAQIGEEVVTQAAVKTEGVLHQLEKPIADGDGFFEMTLKIADLQDNLSVLRWFMPCAVLPVSPQRVDTGPKRGVAPWVN
jgi:hypothetical protein